MTHIPFLRIGCRNYQFGGGTLRALPFDEFNELTHGSFADARALYERTAPVFFVEARPGNQTEPPPGPLVGPARVQAAVNLTIPSIGIPDPDLSVTLFVKGDTVTGSTQGEADLELLFLPDAAGWPLADDVLARARETLPFVDRATGEQLVALRVLGSAATPSLSNAQRLVLCVVALEALLLPDIAAGLGQAFGRRLANLTARDDVERQDIKSAALALYRARSETVHGGDMDDDLAATGTAEALLARAVIALDGLGSETALETLRGRLDDGPVTPIPAVATALPPLRPKRWRRPPVRMSQPNPRLPPFTWSPSLPEVAKGEIVVFAPVPGLSIGSVPDEMADAGFPLTLLTPSQVLALEDRDISRDWAAQLLPGDDVACIAVVGDFAELPSTGNDNIERACADLDRWQNAAVAALRLAGFADFVDPELLGRYAIVGPSFRYRRPTIYRQTALLHRPAASDRIAGTDTDRLLALWELVLLCSAGPHSADFRHLFALFRRAHDALTLPPPVRMQLLFACLELAVGRQPAHNAVHPVAMLASSAPGDDLTLFQWFDEHGRAVRNAVAHGYWDPNDVGMRGGAALPCLRRLLARVIPALMVASVRARGSGATRPRDALKAALSEGAPGLDGRLGAETRASKELSDEIQEARARRYDRLEMAELVRRGQQALDAGDTDLARRWFQRAADAGLPAAMNELGVLERSVGNFDVPRSWYRRAIEAGKRRAVYNMGLLEYALGNGDDARRWFEDAAGAGEAKAMNNLGAMEEEVGNSAAARRWYEAAADAGSVRALDNLGMHAASEGDLDTARAWWEKGAAAGDPASARRLGQLLLESGDADAASRWFETAAAAGDGLGMFWRGLLARDAGEEDEAQRWFAEAARGGVLDAFQELGTHAKNAGNAEEARRHWTAGAEAGHLECALLLGVLDYNEGRGDAWLQRAAAAGYERALEVLRGIESSR